MIIMPTVHFGGRYKIEAFKGVAIPDADGIWTGKVLEIAGSRRLCADWFTNLVTNQGLDYIGSSGTWLAACQVGTSSQAPANSDTGLVGYVAGTIAINSNTAAVAGGSPYYGSRTKVFRFGQGDAAGNLSEVGVGKTAATGSLFSRALIVDGVGSPTTITVLSDEFLDVTFEMRMYVPLADVTGSTTLDGVSRDYTIRAREATNVNVWGNPIGVQASGTWSGAGAGGPLPYTSALAAITSSPSGQIGTGVDTKVNDGYGNGNHYRDCTYYWAPGNSTHSAIKTHTFLSSVGSYQMEFDPVLDKSAPKALTHEFRYSWARRP